MTKEQEQAIKRLAKAQNDILYATLYSQEEQDKDIQTVLNLIQQLQEEKKQKDSLYERTMNGLRQVESELAEKEKIIENAINEVENLRQYFSEDLQVEFISILEILKNKKVIDW